MITVHSELFKHRHNLGFFQKAFVAVDFFSVLVVKDLRGDGPNTEFRSLIPMLPDIDEDDGSFAVVLFFELLHDGRHQFAGNALGGSDIQHGNHAFDRHLRNRTGRNRRRGASWFFVAAGTERTGQQCDQENKNK